MSEQSVVESSTTVAEDVKPEAVVNNTPAPQASKPSPAQDLRDLQALVVTGIYPGNMAPAVVKAYQLLEAMAREVEAKALASK